MVSVIDFKVITYLFQNFSIELIEIKSHCLGNTLILKYQQLIKKIR